MADYETAICEECGCDFIVISNRKYCSRECEYRNLHRRGKIERRKLCSILNDVYTPRKTKQPSISLDDAIEYCREHGITYAQYQSRMANV